MPGNARHVVVKPVAALSQPVLLQLVSNGTKTDSKDLGGNRLVCFLRCLVDYLKINLPFE